MYGNDFSSNLIVDDIIENVDVLSNVLKSEYNISALDGKTVLKISQSDNPLDLVLLDIMMPEMDGYEICKQLKAESQTKTIPVMFFSAADSVDVHLFAVMDQ